MVYPIIIDVKRKGGGSNGRVFEGLGSSRDKQLGYSSSGNGDPSPKRKDLSQSREAFEEVLSQRGIAKAVPRHQRFYTRRIAMKTVLIAVAASLITIFVMRWLRSRKGGK